MLQQKNNKKKKNTEINEAKEQMALNRKENEKALTIKK